MVDFVYVNLLSRNNISYDESDTWWWSDWASVLIAEATHSGTPWLLHNIE
jgi:hypothetical protein